MTMPVTQQIWPPLPGFRRPMLWDAQSARSIPGVERAVGLYTDLISQMPLDAYRGTVKLPRPRILARPDPSQSLPWFSTVMVEDYLLNGNAICYVTSRSEVTGWPTSVQWIPAAWVNVLWWQDDPLREVEYWARGTRLALENVIHVKRGADRFYPVRGVGIVESHLNTLDRANLESDYESKSLSEGAVPSVAIITPNPRLSLGEAEAGKEKFMEKMGGPGREPVFFPAGTQVIPLSWSPSDTQLTEARKMTLVDIANIFHLDSYWLGAPAPGLTYKSSGPMFLNLLRASLEGVLVALESVWSYAWLPNTQTIRYDRRVVLADDFATTVTSVTTATGQPVMTVEEGRALLGLPTTQLITPATEVQP